MLLQVLMQEIVSMEEFIWICSHLNSSKSKLLKAIHWKENVFLNVPKYGFSKKKKTVTKRHTHHINQTEQRNTETNLDSNTT